jgi:hypothetical protein
MVEYESPYTLVSFIPIIPCDIKNYEVDLTSLSDDQ